MQSRSLLSTLALLCLLFAGAKAEARPFRVSQVPNGSQANCLTCHTSGFGGVRNLFGAQVEASFLTVAGPAGSVVWGPALAALDSDGDGYTNGEELGDPSGAWRTGDPNPTLLIATLPGYASCASSAGTGAVCARCGGSADVTQNCPDPCGDSSTYAVAGEACDGTSLGGSTCLSEGFDGGTLACNASCSSLVTTGCITLPTDVCGDGARTGTEACDGGDLNGGSCASQGFVDGTLGCNADCSLDTSGCSRCGDGVLDAEESCDGSVPASLDCSTESFVDGTLGCNADCSLDTSGCTLCGNGAMDAGEVCDGDDFGTTTCGSLGLGEGSLACLATCVIDTTACAVASADVCGDGVATGDEICDGADLLGLSCDAIGFASGELACTADCMLSSTDCVAAETDTSVDAGEDSTGDAISGEDSSDDSGSDAATDTTPATKAKSDEGCSAAGGGSWSWLALLGLLALARRRRA